MEKNECRTGFMSTMVGSKSICNICKKLIGAECPVHSGTMYTVKSAQKYEKKIFAGQFIHYTQDNSGNEYLLKEKTMETFFELKLIAFESNRFPRRKVIQIILGYFSSLTKAEQFMRNTIAQQTFESVYGFYIYERYIDTGCQEPKHICSYNAKGKLNDEQAWSDGNGNLFPFHYRPKDKIRFKLGDIVEEMHHDEVVLGIVGWLQPDEDGYEKLKIHWQHLIEEDGHYRTGFCNGTCMDASDDCYGIYWLGKGDTHSHVQSVDLFPPSRPVPETIIKNLKKKLAELQSCRLK